MTLRDALTEAVLARSPYERRCVAFDELAKWRAARIDSYARAYVGDVSVTIPELNLKLVRFDEWPVTSGELAREYLQIVYADVHGVRCSPRASGFAWAPPILAAPVRHRELAYADIESAFWQLISCFNPDDLVLGDEIVEGKARWLTVDAVAEDRRLRHCVHGTIFSNHLVFYRYGTPVVVPKVSKWSNPSLRLHCMQTLHAVCGRLRRDVNLHAWLTDAAIVDADDAEPVRRFMDREWKLAAKVKAQGAGAVISATTYVVGDKASLDLVNGTATLASAEQRPFSNLRRVPGRQLQAVRQKVA